MKKANILYILLLILLVYPIAMVVDLSATISDSQQLQQSLDSFGISIWITWLFFAMTAVYFKWTEKKDRFFYLTYIFIPVAFGFYGYFYRQAISGSLEKAFMSNPDSAAFFTALLQTVVAAVVTIFLQLSVWWFTQKLHRR